MEKIKNNVPQMTSEIKDLIKNTLLDLYEDQIGIRRKDLEVTIKKKEEPA